MCGFISPGSVDDPLQNATRLRVRTGPYRAATQRPAARACAALREEVAHVAGYGIVQPALACRVSILYDKTGWPGVVPSP